MKSKIIIYIIAALIIIMVAYAAGIHRGRKLAKQDCIDTVAENCDYICGVGSDFQFPDQQYKSQDLDPELVNDTAIALN